MTSHAQIEPIPVSPDDEAESVQPEDENGQAKAEKQAKRKQSAHNTADKSGRVCVAVRMRPLLKTETGGTHFKLKPEKGCVSVFSEVDEVYKPLYFDHVFPPSTCQGTVYSKVAEGFVDDLYRGVSGCVLAYGQTGAGKTYTLLELESYACPRRQSTLQPECRPSAGRYAKLGIIPRLVQAIFDRAEKEASTHDVTIRCSYLQIYMEHVQVFRSPPPHPHPGTHAHAYMHMRVSVHARAQPAAQMPAPEFQLRAWACMGYASCVARALAAAAAKGKRRTAAIRPQ
jgi:hypothetical protein